jgi:hypothetical protein
MGSGIRGLPDLSRGLPDVQPERQGDEMIHYNDNPTRGCQAMCLGTIIGIVILVAIVVLSFAIARAI